MEECHIEILYRMAIPSMRSQVIPKKIPIPPKNRISIYQSFLRVK